MHLSLFAGIMIYKYFMGLLLTVLHSTQSSTDVLSYNKCRDCLRFPSNGTLVSRVERILIDEKNNKLIGGAMNVLFRLELSNMKVSSGGNDSVSLPPSQSAFQDCLQKRLSKVHCQNYIKTLLFDQNGLIFACGTFSLATRCWRFQRDKALSPLPSVKGIKIDGTAPRHGHQQNITATFTSDYLFTGINIGSGTRQSAVYRSTADPTDSSNTLVSDLNNQEVLKDANFVSSFEYKDNFVYFFLREKAVEERKDIIYSRVARVCKYDQGADKYILKGKFTSFVKARLLCSIPGDIPFDYDQIQSTVLYTDPVTNEDFVYAVFTTPPLGAPGSAVCRYSMKSLQDLFEKSQYLELTRIRGEDAVEFWKTVSPKNLTVVPGRPKCDSTLDTKKYQVAVYTFANRHSLLADYLQSKPLFTRADTRFTTIEVDHVKESSRAVVPVMFISSDNGTVFKVFNNKSGDNNPVILEQINLLKYPGVIYTMRLYKGAVYIGSASSVVKLPVQHCNRYQTCRECVATLDPYCGWSKNKCTTFENKEENLWAQDVIHGNFTKVCPQELPTCSLSILKKQVGGTTTLACRVQNGIPLPKVTKWTKDSKVVRVGGADYQIKPGKDQYEGFLEIHNFGINNLGVYACVMANDLGSFSCAMNISGTLPIVSSALVKINGSSLFVCNATGLPTPRVAVHKVISGTTRVINWRQVPINVDSGQRVYYCTAQNQFGSSFSQAVTLKDKQVKAEIRITNEEWSSELLDEKSEKYKTLAGEIRTAVEDIYRSNPALVGFKAITFSKGSVICKLTLIFAATPSNKNAELLADLQKEVSAGKVGYFTVDRSRPVNVEPDEEQTTTQPVFSTVQVTSDHSPTTPQIQEPPTSLRMIVSMDRALFAAGIMTGVLLSLILGILLGVKFHHYVMRKCKRPFSDSTDSSAKNKTIEGVKYTKSPPRDETFTRNKDSGQSSKNLLKKKRNVPVEDGTDSDDSTAGTIATQKNNPSPTKSISPTATIAAKLGKRKPTLNNGKVSKEVST
ncbi:semaphorin-6D-like isoform X2 [Acropora muricata]|uniref:semaphorin-6D-like isoform X2 n=1 Tax=Acropora muricata TaxID=159855 RepID=UPI0034E42F52